MGYIFIALFIIALFWIGHTNYIYNKNQKSLKRVITSHRKEIDALTHIGKRLTEIKRSKKQ